MDLSNGARLSSAVMLMALAAAVSQCVPDVSVLFESRTVGDFVQRGR